MTRFSMLITPRARRIGISLIVIAVCTSCIWSAICGTSDITDNPSLNGGYNRGAIFFLQSPIAVSKSNYAHRLDLPYADPSDVHVPPSCRLKIIRVLSLYGMFAVPSDGIPRMSAEAQFLDGPLAGSTVDITPISARTGSRLIKVDPTYLQIAAQPASINAP